MKRLIFFLLLALVATTAHAQGQKPDICLTSNATLFRNPTPENKAKRDEFFEKLLGKGLIPINGGELLTKRFLHQNCNQIEKTLTRLVILEHTLFQIESEEILENKAQESSDHINGAISLISSKKQADVLQGLNILKNYLEHAEKAFSNTDLKTCLQGESYPWNEQPCNPIASLKKRMDYEFNKREWPIAESPSAEYSWIIDQYTNGAASGQKQLQTYAEINATEIRAQMIFPRIEQLRISKDLARSVQERKDKREQKTTSNATVIGNFTSIVDRLTSSAKDFLLSIFAVFLLTVIIGRIPLPIALKKREKINRAILIAFITQLPFMALYIIFGGWWNQYIKPSIKSPYNLIILLVVFVPACVLVSRWLKGRPLSIPGLLRGGQSAPTPTNDLHGSAHWSDSQSAINAGRYVPCGHVLTDSHGFTLGRAPDADKFKNHDPRLRYMGHVLTVAPNGSGKGIGAVIPALLDYPGSTIVLDIKGENYAVTSRFRREQLGHNIVLIDPFGVTGQPSHSFNWLDRLNPDDPDVVGESATLAEMMVIQEGHTSDSSAHFNESAKSLIRGLMVYVATLPEERRNMGEVRRLLTLSAQEFDMVLAQMMVSKRGFELIARSANTFSDAPQKERGSILSTARRHLAFLDDPRISAALSRSDFSLDDLKSTLMTVYLVMPPARLAANRAFIRAFFGQSINAVMASAGKPQYRILFLLDEFPQLGRMDIVEEKLPLIRGYGGAFWLVAQNLAQLKETYPKWQNFVANCGVKQFFGISDVDTARYISESLGKMTVEFQTTGVNSNAGSSVSMGNSYNQQFTGRELMTADEIMRLPREHELVLISGEAPYLLNRLNYLQDAEYVGKFDSNPYE